MTAQALNFGADAATGPQDYTLDLYTPDGKTHLRRFSFLDPDQNGVVGGIDSAFVGGVCKELNFSGRADLVGGADAEIVHWRVFDGLGWHDAGYGPLTSGWGTRFEEVRPYKVDPDELLRASVVTEAVRYRGLEASALVLTLARRFAHPAVKIEPALVPPTGVTIDDFSLTGATLLKAFEEIAVRLGAVGVSVAYGLDGGGRLAFGPHTSRAEIEYRDTEGEFRDLPVDMAGLCTAVLWVVGNTPSDPGYTSDAYVPGELTWLSVPNPASHRRYGRVVALQPQGDPFTTTRATAYEQVGFTDPGNVTDYNPDTGAPVYGAVSHRAATGGAYFEIGHAADYAYRNRTFGVRIRYRRDFTVTSAVTLRLYYGARTEAQAAANLAGTKQVRADYLLPYSDGIYTTQTYKITPPESFVDAADGLTYVADPNRTVIAAQVFNLGPGSLTENIFAISDFRFVILLANGLLNPAAAREFKVPAREAAQLRPRRMTPDGLQGYFVPPVAQATLKASEWGDLAGPVAEVRYTFNDETGFETVLDLGNANKEGSEAAETIRLGVERRLRETGQGVRRAL